MYLEEEAETYEQEAKDDAYYPDELDGPDEHFLADDKEEIDLLAKLQCSCQETGNDKEESETTEEVERSVGEGGPESYVQKVQDPVHESGRAVFRNTMSPGMVRHRHFGDTKSLCMEERRDVAVHLTKEVEVAHRLSREAFEGATRVVDVKPGQSFMEPVRYEGGKALGEKWVLPVRSPPCHDIEALVHLLKKLRDVLRIVLEVGIESYDDLTLCFLETGVHGRALTEVPPENEGADLGVLLNESSKDLTRPVTAPIIDNDYLVGTLHPLEGSHQSIIEFGNTLGLVERRNND